MGPTLLAETNGLDEGLPACGVGTPLGFGIGARELVEYARAAEAAGLDDVSVGELRSTEVFSLTAAMSVATTRVRVETSIGATMSRAPSLIAMGAATLAQLSNGRFCLGLGAGSPIVAGWHAADFAAPLRTVERTVDQVRSVLAGERMDELGGFRLASEMMGDVPIVVSAMNEGMLRLAGRKADGVVVQFCGPAQAQRMSEIARNARADAGIDRPFEVIVNAWGFAGDDPDQGRLAFRREIAPYLAVPTYRAAAVALSSETEIDTAADRWRAGGRDAGAAAVPESLVEALLIAIGVDDTRARMAEYARAGCDRIRFVPLTPVHGDASHACAVVQALGALRAPATAVAVGGHGEGSP